MSETKWTPGPWEALDGDGEPLTDADSAARNMASIRPVEQPHDVNGYDFIIEMDVHDDAGVATAHLLAAAPELYEALEELLEAIAEIGRCMPPLLYPPVCGDRCVNAMAALSKARNEDVATSDARWAELSDVVRERRAKWDSDSAKSRAALAKARGEAS